MKQASSLGKSRPKVSVLDFTFDEIREFLAAGLKNRNVEKAYIAGSVASGGAGAWSDIDLVVIKKTATPFPERPFEFVGLFDLGVPLDILVYTPEEIARMDANPTAFWRDVQKKWVRIV
ncbi:MAG: hypothetical protein BM485_07950 [Desulfobulbaceae bacterium DB1]|nr:MAG: hypothetical protein BM485_07950 [Desulfobulbaceae bacterium DB1]